jgi:hypothetical protein
MALRASKNNTGSQEREQMTFAQMMPTATVGGRSYFQPGGFTVSAAPVHYRRSPADFVASFYAILRRWQSETAFVSDPNLITSHPSYRALVSGAPDVVELIIAELRRGPSLLVWVLEDALNERPFADSSVGNIAEMTEGWIAWAERNGY